MKKITALKLQKRNKNRVNVYLDGEFAAGLSRIVAGWLQIGQEISEEKLADLLAKDEVEIALQRAVNFISLRPRSEKEVRQNLYKHKTDEETIQTVLEKLRRGGLVDDSGFAEMWVENRSKFRPRGRSLLRMELRQKGIQDPVIEDNLQDVDEGSLAYRAAQKQARKYAHLERQEFRKKLSGFLARRGFPYAIIYDIIPKIWEEFSSQQQT